MPKFKFESKEINYIAKGRGELLIILPGNTASSIVHQEQIDYFSKNYHTASLDFLGTGKSERIAGEINNWWKYAAQQVNALINHLGFDKAKVIGVSGGAIIGMHLASSYPKKVSALVLDSFSSVFTKEMLKKNIINERAEPNEAQEQFWKYCHGEDWREVVQFDTNLIKELVENGGDWLHSSHKNIKCPVLLIGSLKDDFLPEIEMDYLNLAKEMKSCKIAIAEDGNHPLIWTNPTFFNKEVSIFLNDK